MKYILVLLLSSCSYSLHEHNLTQQSKTMLKYDKHSRKVDSEIEEAERVREKIREILSDNELIL